MTVKIQFRRGTAAEWTAANPTLSAGETGFETDTGATKIGTGVATWTSLPYAGGADASTTGKGIVQLAGDLAGTAAAPTVVVTHLAAPLPEAQGGTGAASTALVLDLVLQNVQDIKGWY